MSNLTVQDKNMQAVESALVMNDISKLTPQERMAYYNAICESVGLNPLTKPFAFLQLQGKTVLYATKDCSEQLRKIHGVSTQIISKGVENGMYVVHVRARDKTGREDEDISVIPLSNVTGSDLANLQMKALTKAKRRVTLSICGLGILDESELDTIANLKHSLADNPQFVHPLKEIKEAKQAESEFEMPDEIEAKEQAQGLGDFVCKVGKKYLGKKLSEIEPFELDKYLKWLMNSSKEQKKALVGDFLEFYEKADTYLSGLEFDQEK